MKICARQFAEHLVTYVKICKVFVLFWGRRDGQLLLMLTHLLQSHLDDSKSCLLLPSPTPGLSLPSIFFNSIGFYLLRVIVLGWRSKGGRETRLTTWAWRHRQPPFSTGSSYVWFGLHIIHGSDLSSRGERKTILRLQINPANKEF